MIWKIFGPLFQLVVDYQYNDLQVVLKASKHQWLANVNQEVINSRM